MSLAQINAVSVLCQLLERAKPQINGMDLLKGEHGDTGRHLLRERLLVMGPLLSYVTCPECKIESARVVRELAHDNILLHCDECGQVDSSRSLQETYKVSLPKLIDRLMLGLGTLPSAKKEVSPGLVWQMGMTEPRRGKPLTWYFARHLADPTVAHRLLTTLHLDQAHKSAKIITSTPLPLPEGSPLTDFDVVYLGSIARLSQSKIEFFDERMSAPAIVIPDEKLHKDTLRFVRTQGKAMVDGVLYTLEPRQKDILLALIESLHHELGNSDLRSACQSQADSFSPRKVFDRNTPVYQRFIQYQSGDRVYALQISKEDYDWLT